MTRILCLWLPNWPIQRVLAEPGEGAGREGAMLTRLARREHDTPLVLAEERPRGGQVVACSAAAAEQGVHPGIPVAEAKSLAPDMTIARYEPAADRRELESLAAACEQFSPCVALEEGDAPESLLMDISNLTHLWGSEAKLAARVEAFFTRRGWRVRLAVAQTLGAAWGMARFGEPDRETRRQGDKGNVRGASPPCLPVSLSSCLFSRLPIEALRIAADTAALLRQLGIETIGQLLALPREDLSSRFGDPLLLRLDQFTGAVEEVLTPHRAAAALAASYELEYPTADRAAITHLLAQLAEQLAARLAARDEGALLLVCELKCAGGQAIQLSIGLFEPSASARQWMELLDLHLESAMLAEEVARVTIRAAATGRLGQRQGELFADGWPSDPHQLALLVNRLSSRLGGEQVQRAELRKSALPERAVRYKPMTESRAKTRRGGDKETRRPMQKSRKENSPRHGGSTTCLPVSLSPGLPPPRPLLLYPQPRPIETTSVAPHGPPQVIWLEGRPERIAKHWGPERIETLWWHGPSVRRDYYRVALEEGGHWWIFRRLSDGRWFVHGVFT